MSTFDHVGLIKELIALAIGITQHCSGCIGFHVKALQRLQCTRAELEEMLSAFVYMGGGPALMYTAEVIQAWDSMAAQYMRRDHHSTPIS